MSVSSSTTEAASTSPTTSSQDSTTVKVTGTPLTADSVTIVDDGQESHRTGVALPFVVTLPDNPSMLQVTAEAGSQSTASITCEIDQPGKAVSDSSSGANAVATCTS